MKQMDQNVLCCKIDEYLDKYNECSEREKAERLFAIIGIKGNNEIVHSYKSPLYLDVKSFVVHYIKAFETEDYGYDIPNNEKLLNAISFLSDNEQLAMCRFARKTYDENGYDTSFLDKRINEIKMRIALDKHNYFLFILRWSGSNLKTLLLSYLFFIAVVFIVFLPAPYNWMALFQIDLYEYVGNSFINHLLNTLAIVSGADSAPQIIPSGLVGMILLILGKILFYLLIGNFIIKKIADFFSFE